MNSQPRALVIDPVSSGSIYPTILASLNVPYLLLDTERALHAGLRTEPTANALNFDVDFNGSCELVRDWAATAGITYVVAASESGLELCEYLRANLPGVPSNDPAEPRRRWNKEHIFDALDHHGVPNLRTQAVSSVDEVDPSVFAELDAGHRFVVKPAIGAGSVDVRLVRDEHELRAAIAAIASKTGFFGDYPKALVQQEFPTPYREYVIDTFTAGARHEIIAISVYDKHTNADGDYVYDRIRWLPETDPIVSKLVQYTRQVLDALGVKTGPSHLEVMVGTNCGPRLIDFGARAHGAGHPMKTYYLTQTSQIHRESEYIAYAQPGAELYTLTRHGAIVFFSTDHQTKYDGSVGSADLNRLPGVVESTVNAAPGSTHNPTRSLIDGLGLGLAFVEADNAAELEKRCEAVRTTFSTSLGDQRSAYAGFSLTVR